MQFLGKWLLGHVHFAKLADLPHETELYELWTCLDVELEAARALASELHLHWKDDRLQVSSECQTMPDLTEVMSVALLSVWHFTAFSKSRWITVGKSCKTLVVALLTGLESLVAAKRSDPSTSDYNIIGFWQVVTAGQIVCVHCCHVLPCQRCCLGRDA